MQILPVDLTAIVAVIMGVSIILIPVAGITARFALKPLVESLAHIFQGRSTDEAVKILERRMALLEQQMEGMDQTLHRLAEVTDFHAELQSGAPESRERGA